MFAIYRRFCAAINTRHWELHLTTIEPCFGDELAVRLRASALAQAIRFRSGEGGENELLLVLETFDNERVGWIRWAGECEAIADLDAIYGLMHATGVRFQRVFEIAKSEDHEQIREADWVTRWHEVWRS